MALPVLTIVSCSTITKTELKINVKPGIKKETITTAITNYEAATTDKVAQLAALKTIFEGIDLTEAML